MLVNVMEIVIKSGRRAVNDSKVKELADSISEVGLINPITIDKNLVLIAGRHRLEAYKKLSLDKIEANVIDASDLKTELIEIDENLIRSELHFTESGDLYKRRKAIYEELHPETKHGAKNRSNNYGASLEKTESDFSKSFVSDTAAKTGKSETVIKEELQIANNVIPEVKEVIKSHNIPKSTAIKIARLNPDEQMSAVKKITDLQGTKICPTCGIEKSLDQFSQNKHECKNCYSFRKRVGGEAVAKTKMFSGKDVLDIINDMANKASSKSENDCRVLSDYLVFVRSAIARMDYYLVHQADFSDITDQDEHFQLSMQLIQLIQKIINKVEE